MQENRPVALPFLDWYGVWPSHRKEEKDGRIWSQEPPRGVEIRIEPASKSEIFFTAEKPWEQQANFSVNTVLYEDGRYRLWYNASKVDDVEKNYVCYAESNDGFTWERPALGLVEYQGSKQNNIISPSGVHHLQSVFVDPVAPPEERYKAIAPKGRYYREGKLDPGMDSKKAKCQIEQPATDPNSNPPTHMGSKNCHTHYPPINTQPTPPTLTTPITP